MTRWSSLVAVDVTPTAPVGVTPKTRAVPTLLPKGMNRPNTFGPADAEDGNPASEFAFASQSVGGVQVGVLPRGGSPAALLIMLGGTLLGTASVTWPRSGRTVRRASEVGGK